VFGNINGIKSAKIYEKINYLAFAEN